MFSPNEISELEQIFKDRAVEALESGDALKQHRGLCFLEMLAQIDSQLAVDKKRHLLQMIFQL